MTKVQVLTTDDSKAWQEAAPADACVLASVEWARVLERHKGYSARLFVFESEGTRIVYPMFLRPVEGAAPGRKLWDTFTPEYTGPLLLGATDEAAFAERYREAFARFAESEGIIAEFAHLHPWKAAETLLDPAGVEVNREIVYIDTTAAEDEIWSRSLHTEARRQTKQSKAAGVQVRRAETREDVLEFHRLHHLTMERRAALEGYFIPAEFFLDIFEALPRNAFYLLSSYQGRTVGAGFYLQDATHVFWHLSATDLEFSKVRPVNAFHWEAIRAAHQSGKQRLICGAGYQANDGIFRFKAGFSPLRAHFKIYKRVHDPAAYQALTAAWQARHEGRQLQPGYFPAYRAAVVEAPAAEARSASESAAS
jgi:hypothetical protein